MLERWIKPRIENPDPEIRKQAFAEVDPHEPAYEAAVRSDEDAGVRASLISRITDLELLTMRCSEEEDPGVAAAARERLAALLCGGAEAPSVDVRVVQLERLADESILGSVARGAGDARLRDVALSRIVTCGRDTSRLLVDMASGDADSDLRTRAVDLLDDPTLLDEVAVNVRKSDKDLHRRAREKIRAIRQNEQKEHTRSQLVTDIGELAVRPLEAQNDAYHRRLARLQHWRDGWAGLGLTDEDPSVKQPLAAIEARLGEVRLAVGSRRTILEEIAGPVAADSDAAAENAWRERWALLENHRESDHAAFERALSDYATRRRHRQRRDKACASAATLLGEWEATDWSQTVVDEKRRQHLDEHWRKIALPEDAGADFHARYAAMRDRLRDMHARQQAAAQITASELEALVKGLAEHLLAGRSAEATSAHDKINHRLSHGAGLPAASAAKIRKRLVELEPELRKLKEWKHWGADQAREQLAGEAEALIAQAAEMKASKLANRVKTLRERWQKIDKGVGAASAGLWKRFDTACEAAYAPAKQVFDKQAEERRENAAKKRAICDRIEAYTRDTDWSSPDWQAATSLLDECRREWREIGGVSHHKFAKLRDRHRRVVAALDEKLDEERQSEIRRRTLAIASLKQRMEREPLSDLIETAKKIQREWRPTVRSRRKEEQALWDSLREVCDAIFAQRDEKFASRREEESTSRKTREALCAEIGKLLVGDEHDEAAVNLASGRFEEIRREWRDAGPLAPKQKAALERRYRGLCKDFESRRDRLRKREHGRQTATLLSRALLVEEQCQRLALDQGADCEDLRSAWQALPATRGALAKRLDAAFASGATGISQTAANLEAKRELCLRMEMLADTPSPPEYQAQRMALKIAMLKDSLSGGSGGKGEAALPDMLVQWYSSAPVDAAEWAPLRERFENAARALIGGA